MWHWKLLAFFCFSFRLHSKFGIKLWVIFANTEENFSLKSDLKMLKNLRENSTITFVPQSNWSFLFFESNLSQKSKRRKFIINWILFYFKSILWATFYDQSRGKKRTKVRKRSIFWRIVIFEKLFFFKNVKFFLIHFLLLFFRFGKLNRLAIIVLNVLFKNFFVFFFKIICQVSKYFV